MPIKVTKNFYLYIAEKINSKIAKAWIIKIAWGTKYLLNLIGEQPEC